MLRWLLLAWLGASAVSAESTGPVLLAGPWTVLQPDGGVVIGVELALDSTATAASLRLAVRHAPTGAWRDLPALPKVERWQRRPTRLVEDLTSPASCLATFTLKPPWPSAPSELVLRQGPATTAISLPRRPAEATKVRLLVVGAANYPTVATIERWTREWSGPPDLVVLVGDGLAGVLGTGGWEAGLPLVILDRAGRRAAGLVQAVGNAPWAPFLHWGPLSLLPVGSPQAAALALAQDLAPWRIPVMPDGSWVLQRFPTTDDQRDLTGLLATCQPPFLPRLPLVLLGAEGCGWISDPLSLDREQQVVAAEGGTRFVGLDAHGAVVHQLPAEVARLSRSLGWLGLEATSQELHLAFHFADDRLPWHLRWDPWPIPPLPDLRTVDSGLVPILSAWRAQGLAAEKQGRCMVWRKLSLLPVWGAERRGIRRILDDYATLNRPDLVLEPLLTESYSWPSGGVRQGSGWGLGNASALATALGQSTGSERAQVVETLSWLTLEGLHRTDLAQDAIRSLIEESRTDPGLHPLIERLIALPGPSAGTMYPPELLPGDVVPGHILRLLSFSRRAGDNVVARQLAGSTDPWLLQAVLPLTRTEDGLELLQGLVTRFQNQAEGRLPIDADPLLGHDLAVAVFDSPYLSPTPLRALARALQDRVAPLARGPLQRFLQRHGDWRPAHR